jgi:branched-chain amino acid transport system substrate-binding protein
MTATVRRLLAPGVGLLLGVALVAGVLPALVDEEPPTRAAVTASGAGAVGAASPAPDDGTTDGSALAAAPVEGSTPDAPAAGGTRGATAGATAVGSASSRGGGTDVGVTPTTIRIGVWVPDIGAIAGIPGLGDTGFDPSTYRNAYQTFADELNAKGGVHGRKVELVFYTMDATNEADANQQGCVFFTQQEKVFAIFNASVAQGYALDCIHKGSGAVAYSSNGFEPALYRGGWLVTQEANMGRVLRAYVQTVDRRGELKGKRLALMEQAKFQRLSDELFLPLLEAAGYSIVHRSTMSDDTGQLGGQIPVEVNQLRAKQVDVVLSLMNVAQAGLVIQQADGQGFRPRWLMSDFGSGTDDLGPKLFPAGTNAAGVTALRSGEFRVGRPEAAYDARCAARYNARTSGRKVRNASSSRDNPYRYALYGCTAFDVFAAAALAAGPDLTRAGWLQAVSRLGTLPIGFAADGSLQPGKLDAGDRVRLLKFQSSCSPDGVNCWLPDGEFQPAG